MGFNFEDENRLSLVGLIRLDGRAFNFELNLAILRREAAVNGEIYS